MDTLKREGLISDGCADILENSFSGIPKAVMERILKKGEGQHVGAYSEELKSFAMTLHFYSAKAYEYVRDTFDLALPSTRQIRNWYSKVEGGPGFTEESFSALKRKVDGDKVEGRKTLCSLMMDEMSLKKHLDYSGGKYEGYVDIGTGQVDDSTTLPMMRLF